ncbi:hypothetical protein JYK02_01355 [Corallococcus macrosporus]|uniref:Aminoglycoside phosphotransferase domain-containing protein n=1 Tax=Corallococcus macrosporus TaxID=35 RepID=A0ABS3D786_9BACT|nr:hypothetical protein [Corallococcus macrosporus]MBN8226150.1 hypothetical protein [Corallococcus macrosporus]
MSFAGLFALAVDAVSVHAVGQEQGLWVKRRRAGMGAVIAIGNVFLYQSRSRIRMFSSCARWQERELASFKLLHPGRFAEPRGKGAVALEALPGEGLDQLATRGEFTPEVAEAAARELRRAHALVYPGTAEPWSHGDAHLKNFLYEAAGARAWLIDFETRHEAHLAPEARHADDLLVFLLDLAGRVPRAEELSRAFLRAYARENVLRALLARLRPPRGLERALWRSRSGHLPQARLLGWLEHLREDVIRLTQSPEPPVDAG